MPVNLIILFGIVLILGFTYKSKKSISLKLFKLNLIKLICIISGGCDFCLNKIFCADFNDHDKYSKSRIYKLLIFSTIPCFLPDYNYFLLNVSI
mgnify:FL=1